MKQADLKTTKNIEGTNLYLEYFKKFDNRPTIVFLHDSLGSVQLWRDFPAKLGKELNYNVLVYDRQGFGKSDPLPTYKRQYDYLEAETSVLNNLLTELKIEEAILFGHSDGGSIALIAASMYPEKIKAIIVEAGHVFVEDFALKGINEAIHEYEQGNLAERLEKYHGDKTDTVFKAWTKTWTSEAFRDWSIEHFLPGITCPLLFIQGENDEYATLDQVERTVSQVSGRAEKFIVPGAGHTPHKEVPEAIITGTAEFLKNISKA